MAKLSKRRGDSHTYPAVGAHRRRRPPANSAGGVTATTGDHRRPTHRRVRARPTTPTELGYPTTLFANITGGSNVIYQWALGDGATGSGAVTRWAYWQSASHSQVVTASNSTGVVTATTAVTIADQPIAADMVPTQRQSRRSVGQATTLTGSVSTAGSNVTYTWTLGDGELTTGRCIRYLRLSGRELHGGRHGRQLGWAGHCQHFHHRQRP